jgi:hypothetical protein
MKKAKGIMIAVGVGGQTIGPRRLARLRVKRLVRQQR